MKKFISLFMTMVMCFVFAMPVLALDTASEGTAPITRERAIEILGVTEEEVEGLELMPMPTSSMAMASGYEGSSIPTELPPGMYYEEISLGNFTGRIHKILGPSFKWSFALGEVDADDHTWSVAVNMLFTNQNREGNGVVYFSCQSSNTYDSRVFKNTNNEDIYFKYWFLCANKGKALVIVLVYNNPQ